MRSNAALHYLDNAATTMVDPAVADAIHTALLNQWANPSSLYEPAVLAQMALGSAGARWLQPLAARRRNCTLLRAVPRATTLRYWARLRRGAAGGIRSSFRVLNTRAFKTRSVRWEKPVCGWWRSTPAPTAGLRLTSLLRRLTAVRRSACCMAVNNETEPGQDIARLAAGVKAQKQPHGRPC